MDPFSSQTAIAGKSYLKDSLGAGALGRPRRMVWGGRREEGSGWGTHVYLWQIHFDIWQQPIQYCKVKILKKKKKKKRAFIIY